jgi:hypothetical protein
MTEFLNAILSFPTVLFTIPMGVVLGYWLTVIIGAVGVDLLDGDFGDFALGAKQGSGEALKGLAGGATEGGAEAGASLFEVLGFTGVPATVSVSFVVFFSWLLSLALTGPAQGLLGSFPGMLVSGVLTVAFFVGGTALAGQAVRPLRSMFAVHQAPRRASLLGKVCVISSSQVDGKFGQATLEDGGAGLLLHVVCDEANELKRGDKALVLGYDPARDAYEVEPVDWLLPEEVRHLEDPLTAEAVARERARSAVSRRSS